MMNTVLPKKEQKAFKEIKNMQVIVITNAEKGVTVAILNIKDYIKDLERELKVTEY